MATTPPATPRATQSGIHLDSVVTGVSHLHVGPGLVFDTPKSKCRGKVRRYGAKRTLFDAGDHQGDRRVSAPTRPDTASVSRPDVRFPPWTTQEDQALVSFMLLYTEGASWSSRRSKGDQFWDKAGQYVQTTVNSEYCRTGECTSHQLSMLFTVIFQDEPVG